MDQAETVALLRECDDMQSRLEAVIQDAHHLWRQCYDIKVRALETHAATCVFDEMPIGAKVYLEAGNA